MFEYTDYECWMVIGRHVQTCPSDFLWYQGTKTTQPLALLMSPWNAPLMPSQLRIHHLYKKQQFPFQTFLNKMGKQSSRPRSMHLKILSTHWWDPRKPRLTGQSSIVRKKEDLAILSTIIMKSSALHTDRNNQANSELITYLYLEV